MGNAAVRAYVCDMMQAPCVEVTNGTTLLRVELSDDDVLDLIEQLYHTRHWRNNFSIDLYLDSRATVLGRRRV